MSEFTPKGFSNGQYVDRFLLRDKLYEEDAITMGGVAILNNFPAADVVEVKHGEWMPVGKEFPMLECDKCHWISLGGNYCPNCGAKMDGGQDDE